MKANYPALGIVALGVLFRAFHFFSEHSLYVDEAALALNIVNRSFADLALPLDHMQFSPFGFLVVEKMFVTMFGNNEYTLRLFPFICSLVSLFLFYKLAQRLLRPKAFLVALLIFSASKSLLFFSASVKPYSSDVLFCLLILLCALKVLDKQTGKNILCLAAAGGLSIWFSFTACIVLTGIGTYMLIQYVREKNWSGIRQMVIPYSVWALSFLLFYMFFLKQISESRQVGMDYWSSSFYPWGSSFVSQCRWLLYSFLRFLTRPLGFSLAYLTAAVFICGCTKFSYLKGKTTVFLLAPLLASFLFSMLSIYPFGGRLVLFLVPIGILLIVSGLEFVVVSLNKIHRVIGVLFLIFFFMHPLYHSATFMLHPENRTGGEIKPLLTYLREHLKEGDIVYVEHSVHYALDYYKERYSLNKPHVRYITTPISSKEIKAMHKNIEKTKKQRLWILCFRHRSPLKMIWVDKLDKTRIKGPSLQLKEFELHLYQPLR